MLLARDIGRQRVRIKCFSDDKTRNDAWKLNRKRIWIRNKEAAREKCWARAKTLYSLETGEAWKARFDD